MRKFQIWFAPVSLIIGLVVTWIVFTVSGFAAISSQLRGGYYVGGLAVGIIQVLLTAWLIFDVIVPIIRATRSVK